MIGYPLFQFLLTLVKSLRLLAYMIAQRKQFSKQLAHASITTWKRNLYVTVYINRCYEHFECDKSLSLTSTRKIDIRNRSFDLKF